MSTSALRNQSMECWKLVASFFVVSTHVRFPGAFGTLICSLAGFSMPLFFAISGYFNFQAPSAKVGRRLVHILKLNLWAFLVHVLWGCFVTEYYHGSSISYLRSLTPNPGWPAMMLTVNEHPFFEQANEHLWYLIAIAVCYAIFWFYTRFFENHSISYRPLYTVGVFLLLCNLLIGEFSSACGIDNHYLLIRNGLTLGFPMFTLGLFLREYQQRILENFRLTPLRLSLLVAAFSLLALMEGQAVGDGFLIGNILTVMAIVLLAGSNPVIDRGCPIRKRLFAAFGPLSTIVYILHSIVLEGYELFLQEPLGLLFPTLEYALRPVTIIVITLLCGFVYLGLKSHVSHIRK